jgi:Transcriptional regulator containing PAS, AAA-type ATPase, and DNA-binding domains
MHNGVVAFDDKGCISLTNKSAEKMLGLSSGKSLGLRWDEVITGLDLQPVLIQGEVKTGLKYVHGNIVVNIMPIIDDITVTGAVAVFHDLTELKQMTRKLKATKNLNQILDAVINITYDGIVVVDERGHVTLINQVLADFLKVKPEDVLDKHITKVIQNTRLHIVSRTGVPELREIQIIGDKQYLVSEIQELVRKLNAL